MNEYELSKLADMMDEDAVYPADLDWQSLVADVDDTDEFREKYLSFYDDIKTNPYDDW